MKSLGPAGIHIVIIVFLLALQSTVCAGEIGIIDWTWKDVNGLIDGRDYQAAGVLGDSLYVVGGRDSGQSTVTNTFRFDGTNWTEVAGLPEPRNQPAASVLNGFLYSIGGGDGSTPQSNVYRFDSANWTEVLPLPTSRSSLTAATLNGALYAIGGNNGGAEQTNVYRYAGGTNWTEVSGLPVPRQHFGAAALNGFIYAVGGNLGGFANTNVYRFDGTNWTEAAGLPAPRRFNAVAVRDGAIYSIGGHDSSSNPQTNVYRFDGATWTEVSGLPARRALASAGTLGNILYAVGGYDTSYVGQTNVYRFPASIAPGVAPDNGPWSGGNQVIITGVGLGDGSDITNVTLCGVDVASISSQASTQIVVMAGAGGSGLGDVRVFSTSSGETISSDAYTYNPAGQIRGSAPGPFAWTNLGEGIGSPVGSSVLALALDTDNTLYAAGMFTNAGSLAANRVAKWDGVSWTNLNAGVKGNVLALALDTNGHLYAGGFITNAGAGAADYIVKWDGTSWTNVGEGMDDAVRSLDFNTNGALFAGGDFTNAGGGQADNVAKWDGAGWTNVGAGLTQSVYTIALGDENALYAGGHIYNVNGTQANYIAKWNGTAWTTLGDGLNNHPRALVVTSNGALYAGGEFTIAGGTSANHVAKWNGSNWTSPSSGMNDVVDALAMSSDGALYAAGHFTNAGGVTANHVARWDGSSWTNLGSGLGYTVNALAAGQNGILYAGGRFTNAGALAVNRIAKWGPTTVETLGVAPSSGSWTGGYQVVITGTNLCNGSDVANVTLVGVNVTSIESQSATQIIVVAGAGGPGSGDVRTFSTSFGETLKSSAFTYVGGGGIGLETNLLSFIGIYDGAAPPNGYLFMRNVGATSFIFTNNQTYGAGASNWLTVIPDQETMPYPGNAALANTVDLTGLNAGTYYATNVVSSPDATNSPQSYVVMLTVDKADQTITFPTIADQVTTNKIGLAATATSGLSVSFSVDSGPATITGNTNLSFTGAGTVMILADQIGDTNWNAAPTASNTFNVTKALASVTLSDLSQVYDGTPKSVTTSTSPTGLALFIVYQGLTGMPVNAGSYPVFATVNDPMYQGGAADTLVIAKRHQTIIFHNPPTQEATNKLGLAATAESGLPVSFSVASGPAILTEGTNVSFTGPGAVTLRGEQSGNTNWNTAPVVSNTFSVIAAAAGVTLGNLNQSYNGTPRAVSVTTVPAGLAVDVTYDGSATPPTLAGSYAVTGTVNEVLYTGEATGILTINAGNQTITFAPIRAQRLSSKLGLSATASSELPVSFAVQSGPAVLTGGTNLSFTAPGRVSILASQTGDANWSAAPNVARSFRVQAQLRATDYNNDGISDLAVYNPSAGTWYIRRMGDPSALPIAFNLLWGGSTLEAVPGDYNGDRVADPAVYDFTNGRWYIRDLRPGKPPILFDQVWGDKYLTPVPGDYDGDDMFDLAVFETTSGMWYIRSLGNTNNPPIAFGVPWGNPEMTPVSGDYNGDGFYDIAVYHEATGNWYIRRLDDTNAPPICFGQNWGGPGFIPVAGDYNADGASDLAVYEISTGEWFIRSLGDLSAPPITFGQQWGGNGTIPVPGDYDGNGAHDLSVFETATGSWFVRRLGPDAGSLILFGFNWGNADTDAVGASE